uniref:Uncharacterized protein n=1 Tax=Anopheles maculatus TaxID=74869 RepID=A0A182TCG5_9DIPT
MIYHFSKEETPNSIRQGDLCFILILLDVLNGLLLLLLLLLLLRPVLPGVTDDAASGSFSSPSLGQLVPGRLSVEMIVFIFTLCSHRSGLEGTVKCKQAIFGLSAAIFTALFT